MIEWKRVEDELPKANSEEVLCCLVDIEMNDKNYNKIYDVYIYLQDSKDFERFFFKHKHNPKLFRKEKKFIFRDKIKLSHWAYINKPKEK
jgi:hypothetical protein